MYYPVRSLFRRRQRPARPSVRARLGLEVLEERSLLTSTLGGFVYVDANDNGMRDVPASGPAETGITGVTLQLTGTDIDGNAVNLTTTTDTDGSYLFQLVPPSDATGYTLTETQPPGFLPGKNAVGTINGVQVGTLAGPV